MTVSNKPEMVNHRFTIKALCMVFNQLDTKSYMLNNSEDADFCYDKKGSEFSPRDVREAIVLCNSIFVKLDKTFSEAAGLRLLEVIDKKQTGAFVGAIFIAKFLEVAKYLSKNPSPTGHPDLIPSRYIGTGANYTWDQFPHGGVEIKTSCGSLPSGKTLQLSVGNARIKYVSNIVWKGHHNEINNLLGLFWDYYPEPTIFGAFYSNELIPSDFTNTVPKKGGGHTTNVCITKASAIAKMGKNWVVLANEKSYLGLFEKKMNAVINTLV